jgi:hypothetical protein
MLTYLVKFVIPPNASLTEIIKIIGIIYLLVSSIRLGGSMESNIFDDE